MKTFTFGGIHGGSTTPENGFLSPDSIRRFVLDAPRDHRQFHSEDIRSQRWVTLITMAMVPGTITNSHIPLAALQQRLTFCSLQTSISILGSNSNSYTLHRRYSHQLHSHIVYFHPTTFFLRAELWGNLESQGTLSECQSKS